MEANRYEIMIRGTLTPDWAEWFDGMEIRQDSDGNTVLVGWIDDQSALHGCLGKLHALNLPLISVNPAASATARRR